MSKLQAFGKLGAKFTTKPAECTHLVAKSFVRTEKFLCGMASASHVVHQKWIETSVQKRKILRKWPLVIASRSNLNIPL